ncbi:MAG: DUF4430 domain-containing protein [Clostridia bacterium]|nr:DUF4430 domain-containing protein [Clostridia bacterium]
MRNRLLASALIVVIILSLFTGCKIESVDQYHRSDQAGQRIDQQGKPNVEPDKAEPAKTLISKHQQQDGEEQPPLDSKTNQKDKQETKTQKDGQDTNSRNKNKEQNAKDIHTGEKPTQETGTKQALQPKAKQSLKKEVKSNPPQQTESKKQQPKPQKHVTLTIKCHTILKNRDKLDPALNSERFVPSDGVILKKTKFELKDGETVFDILVKATRKYRIHMQYQGADKNQYGSVYVQGINNLYEFSCGELSGWMYCVNGRYPNYGCSLYKLKEGDDIQWNYTCDLGRDLGVKWLDK